MNESSFFTVGLISGGYDPIHVGHISLIEDAGCLCDEVWIILNNDNWLMSKKGYVFMPEEDRRRILLSIKGVTRVFISNHDVDDKDTSVCKDINNIYNFSDDNCRMFFMNGGDRVNTNTPEISICNQLGITVLYGVGGGKIQSSSELVRNANEFHIRT